MVKIKIYHFHNGNGGGVLSVIKNILKFSSNGNLEYHIIHAVNKAVIPFYDIEPIEGAVTQQLFYYSTSNNLYYTLKKLAKLLPDESAIIVTHDWLELALITNLGLKNRAINFLHGDYEYYYQLAISHQASIDKFIPIANSIAQKLILSLPGRKGDIQYLRFPVPSPADFKKQKKLNNIIFIGRLVEGKGYLLLPQIDRLLKEKSIFLNWHIVGEGQANNHNDSGWDTDSIYHLYGSIKNEEVLSLLQGMDFFILPSSAEGMPVSLIEAMKAGVIPFVNDIQGGIQELVNDDFTGYKIINNEVVIYAQRIENLMQNKSLVRELSINCIELANKLFDPYVNAAIIESETMNVSRLPLKNKIARKLYGSRLDQKWLPNIITKTLRNSK